MLVISASAGTGKTFTVIRIINNLLLHEDREELKKPDENGYKLSLDKLDELIEWLKKNFEGSLDLDNLAAITFTEKAATELIDRIRESIENSNSENKNVILAKLSKAKISTIHSFCLQILKQSLMSVNMEPWFIDPNIKIVEGQLNDKVIDRAIIKVLNRNEEWNDKIAELLNQIPDNIDISFTTINNYVKSIIKKYLYLIALPEEKIIYPNEKINNFHKIILDFAKAVYEEIRNDYLRENRIDFNAILYETYKYLSNSKESLKEINNKLKLIIIDEFQDTDPLQWEILNMLSAEKILVGDVKQSIYEFRGAVPEILDEIAASEENLTINLTTNFRSVKKINNFVEYMCDKGFFEKRSVKVNTINKDIEKGGIYLVDPFEKYDYLVKLIKWIMDNKLVDNYGEITVLCSRKNELYGLKKELKKYMIKYALIDETDLFSKSEIVPLRAFILLLNDSQQNDAMLAYLTQLPFSISESIIYEESNKSKRYGGSLFEKLENSKDPEIGKALEIYQKYYSMKEYVSLYKIVKNFMEETDYLPKISLLPDGEERYINVSRFLEELLNMEESGYRLSEIANSLTEEEFLTSKSLYENDPESLKLMTIHKSKGLENKVIIYINPYRKNKDSDNSKITVNKTNEKYMPVIAKAIDEYKTENLEYQRLFYVAITRPKEYLFMINKEENIKQKTYQNDLINKILSKEGKGKWKKDDEKLKTLVNFLSENNINEVDLSDIEPKKMESKIEEIELNYIKDYTNLAYKKFHSPTKLYKYDEILKDTEEEVKYIYDDDKKIMSINEYERFNEKDDGILVHRLMEHIKNGFSLEEVINKFFDTVFNKIEDEDKNKIKNHLKKWIGSDIFNEMEKAPESHNEFKIDKSIKVNGRTMVLTGVVDKIFKNEDGSWSVIDYKYSTKKDIEKYKFQLEFYTYCLKDLLKIKDINLIFLKEKPENGVWKMNLDDIDFECFLNKLKTVIEIEENK